MFTRKIMTLALATAFIFGTAALQSANDPAALEAALANLSKELEKADAAGVPQDVAPQPPHTEATTQPTTEHATPADQQQEEQHPTAAIADEVPANAAPAE